MTGSTNQRIDSAIESELLSTPSGSDRGIIRDEVRAALYKDPSANVALAVRKAAAMLGLELRPLPEGRWNETSWDLGAWAP